MLASHSRSTLAGLVFAAAVCLLAREAAADSFESTRTSGLRERRSRIALRFDHDHVELVVQRSVFNSANISDQATWLIDLPEGAVATALRTQSVGPGTKRWFSGELMEAEKAAERYRELTGIGGYYPKDPALLSWRDQSLLALQVFPCPPHAEKVVEYTLAMPTQYREGAYHISLPAMGTESRLSDLHVEAVHSEDRLLMNGSPVRPGGNIALDRTDAIDLALVPAAAAALEADLVSLPFAAARVLTRFAVRAGPRLSRVPERAYLVVLIDASRSVGGEFEGAAKVAIDAYLSHFADAHVELMTFNRQPTRVLGRFEDVPSARRALSRLALSPKNGSDLDQALFQADQLLASAPPASPRRIVVVTDGRARASLTGERLRGALSQSNAVLHIGLLDAAGEAKLSRKDEHPWASALRSRHGLVWTASAPAALDPDQERRTRRVFEQWARPTRIDNLGTFSDNQGVLQQLHEGGLGTSLAEGNGVEGLFLDPRATRSLSVSGELWLEPVRVLATPSPASEARWAGLSFGSALLNELNESEMMPLALLGHAVSPVTSYLAIEPGVRPSTEGLDRTEQGYGHGAGTACGYGMHSVSSNGPAIDRQAYLENALAGERRRCGGSARASALEIETTQAEIVRVDLSPQSNTRDPLVESCLIEAAWALALPVGFNEDWQQFRVEL
ncbi:MAG TPA: vWA domain-containing protein [Polyangiaceae bacterium]|nr:vWA domain-containing protein [Polyangiaceae bacterium]